MRNRLDRLLTLALAAMAVAVGTRAIDQVFLESSAEGPLASREPTFVEEWREGLPLAVRVAGSRSARVTILALVDLQCPACRDFHVTATEVVAERPDDVHLLYAHDPLDYHPSALPAARVAECALEEGEDAFARWIDAVFAGQDSLGERPWTSYARDAGLAEPDRVAACASDASLDERVLRGHAFGERIGVIATPTVLVNGWRYLLIPGATELRAAVDRALAAGG